MRGFDSKYEIEQRMTNLREAKELSMKNDEKRLKFLKISIIRHHCVKFQKYRMKQK